MGRPRLYANDAEKQAAFRARKDLVAVTVDLPREVVEGLNAYLQFKDRTKSEVLAKLIRTQLMRRR